MNWKIYKIKETATFDAKGLVHTYTIIELKCPKCRLRKTITHNYMPGIALHCEVCDKYYKTPELGGDNLGT